MIAIIAEKPSLARNIVAGIGEMKKKNGYFENAEYIVTWAFGHLFSLCCHIGVQGKPYCRSLQKGPSHRSNVLRL